MSFVKCERLIVLEVYTPFSLGFRVGVSSFLGNRDGTYDKLLDKLKESYEKLPEAIQLVLSSKVTLLIANTPAGLKAIEVCYPPGEEETARKLIEVMKVLAKLVPHETVTVHVQEYA